MDEQGPFRFDFVQNAISREDSESDQFNAFLGSFSGSRSYVFVYPSVRIELPTQKCLGLDESASRVTGVTFPDLATCLVNVLSSWRRFSSVVFAKSTFLLKLVLHHEYDHGEQT